MAAEPAAAQGDDAIIPSPATTEIANKIAAAFDAAKKGEPKPEQKKPDAVKPPEVTHPKVEPTGNTLDDILDPPKPKDTEPEKDELDDFKDPKTANFSKLREITGEKIAKVKELEAKVAELTAKTSAPAVSPELQAQLDTANAKIEEMSANVKAADITLDPAFKAKFIDGRESMIAKAVARVTDGGAEGQELRDALSLTGKKRNDAVKEVLSSLDETDRSRVVRLLDQVEELDEQRTEAMKDTGRTWEEIQKGRQSQTVAEKTKAAQLRSQEIAQVAEALPADFVLLRKALPSAKDADAWNAEVEQARKDAEFLASPDAPVADVAKAILKGLRADKLQELFLAERKARIAAEGEPKKFDAASPNPTGQQRQQAAQTDYPSPAQRFAKLTAA